MARTGFALPLTGLNPSDPALTPGLTLMLTPRQQRELAAALRQAPQPAHVLRLVREGLQRRQSLTRILEDLRARNALAVLRQYAAPPQGRAELYPPTAAAAVRDLPRLARSSAPAPKPG